MDEELRESLRTPFWCPICEVPMKSGVGGDDKTYFKFGACRYCFVEFIEHREQRWIDGWRPTAEQVARLHEKMTG